MAKNKWDELVDQSDEVEEDGANDDVIFDQPVQESDVFMEREQVVENELFANSEYSICDLTPQEIKLLHTLEGYPKSYSFEFLDNLNNLVNLKLAVEIDGEFMRGSKWTETIRSLKGTIVHGCPSCN